MGDRAGVTKRISMDKRGNLSTKSLLSNFVRQLLWRIVRCPEPLVDASVLKGNQLWTYLHSDSFRSRIRRPIDLRVCLRTPTRQTETPLDPVPRILRLGSDRVSDIDESMNPVPSVRLARKRRAIEYR